MSLPSDQVAALADELASLAKGLAATEVDPIAKKHQTHAVVMKAKSLITQIQDPMEACMQHTTNFYVIAAVRSLMEFGVFEAVPASGSIVRLMRQLTCAGIFSEVKLSEWSHTPQSLIMSTHAGLTGRYFFQICVDEMMPATTPLHLYFRKFGKKDVRTYTDTPHSWAFNKLGSNFWEVLMSEPGRLEAFSRGLSLFEDFHPIIGVFPFEELLQPNNSPDRPLAVDVGGGHGLALLKIREGCPSLKGKLVLQDRKEVLGSIPAEELPGVEKMEHDFFTPQPVKHSQVYYIRRVFHDWQDEEACKILQAIAPAMAPDSRILISDMALPEPVGPEDDGAVWLDLMMMTIGGKERTKMDWEKLIEKAGLRLVKTWQTPWTGPLAVVEIMLKEPREEKEGENRVQEGKKTEIQQPPVPDGHKDVEEPDIAKGIERDHVDKVAGHAEAGETTTHGAEAQPRELAYHDEAI